MATYGRTLRRGLPRHPGAEPWPPAGDAPDGVGVVAAAASALVPQSVAAGAATSDPREATAEQIVVSPAVVPQSVAAGAATSDPREATAEPVVAVSNAVAVAVAGAGGRVADGRPLRRGLPRVAGGEPWPPAGLAAATAASGTVPQSRTADATVRHPQSATAEQQAAGVVGAAAVAAATTPDSARPLRRGLPRVTGGEPWPPAGFAPAPTSDAAPAPLAATAAPQSRAATAAPQSPAAGAATVHPHEATAEQGTQAPSRATAVAARPAPAGPAGPRAPLTVPRTVWPGAATARPAPKPEPQRIGPFTKGQWAGIVVVGGGGLLVAAAMVVLFVRAFISLPFMQEFLTTYPGEYHLPEGAPVGLPAWLGWQHFFNVFFMVLIIRTGIQVRTEKRPTVFWAPRSNGKGKISLNLWLHQALDVLWLTNGVIFVVLLFTTGQWMRIVPTSWEVFPNAISAALQYVSLDWPTENGWVNYNSLQQLAYFATVFLAAPLAAITGVRMSKVWPNNPQLNKAYPVEWARAVHFPTMIYFVLFIVVHVTLVFATGALRNLNHMYASQDVVNWAGFWIFSASMLVIAGAWVAARPLVVAPIARVFGTVSGR